MPNSTSAGISSRFSFSFSCLCLKVDVSIALPRKPIGSQNKNRKTRKLKRDELSDKELNKENHKFFFLKTFPLFFFFSHNQKKENTKIEIRNNERKR